VLGAHYCTERPTSHEVFQTLLTASLRFSCVFLYLSIFFLGLHKWICLVVYWSSLAMKDWLSMSMQGLLLW